MAITSAQISVGTTATALNTATSSGQRLVVTPVTTAVVLGASTVTATTGLSVAAGTVVYVDLQPGETLYGIVSSGTTTTHVLRSGS